MGKKYQGCFFLATQLLFDSLASITLLSLMGYFVNLDLCAGSVPLRLPAAMAGEVIEGGARRKKRLCGKELNMKVTIEYCTK